MYIQLLLYKGKRLDRKKTKSKNCGDFFECKDLQSLSRRKKIKKSGDRS